MKWGTLSEVEFRHAAAVVLDEIGHAIGSASYEDVNRLFCEIQSARRVFLAGAGRSRQMLGAFAMRLMHIGFTAHMVGDVTTPAIGAKDLLIVASGSGETSTVVVIAEKARKAGARIVLITARRFSTLKKIAETSVVLPVPGLEAVTSQQVGAAAFEQVVLILGDVLIMLLAKAQGMDEANTSLQARHANLE